MWFQDFFQECWLRYSLVVGSYSTWFRRASSISISSIFGKWNQVFKIENRTRELLSAFDSYLQMMKYLEHLICRLRAKWHIASDCIIQSVPTSRHPDVYWSMQNLTMQFYIACIMTRTYFLAPHVCVICMDPWHTAKAPSHLTKRTAVVYND